MTNRVRLARPWMALVGITAAALIGAVLVLPRGLALSGRLRREDGQAAVLDEAGFPVPGVGIFIESRQVGQSDTEGAVLVEGIGSPRVGVEFRKEGYARLHLPELPLPPQGTHELVLTRGSPVTLHVLDPEGRPVHPRSVVAVIGSLKIGCRRLDGHVARFEDLPRQSRRFVASIGGASYETTASAEQEQVTLGVPPHGSLDLVFEGASGGYAELELTVGGHDSRHLSVPLRSADGGSRASLRVASGELRVRGRLVSFGEEGRQVLPLEVRGVTVGAGETARLEWDFRR